MPDQQYTRTTWMTVELGHAFQHTFRLAVAPTGSTTGEVVPLLTAGPDTVSVRARSVPGAVEVSFGVQGPTGFTGGVVTKVPAGQLPHRGGGHRSGQAPDPGDDGRHLTLETTLAERDPVVVSSELAAHRGRADGDRCHGVDPRADPVPEPGREAAQVSGFRPRKSMMPPSSNTQATDS